MNGEAGEIEFFQMITGMLAITVISGIFFIVAIYLSFNILSILNKSKIRRKLKKIEKIADFEIICNSKGLPVTLINKTNNNTIIL